MKLGDKARYSKCLSTSRWKFGWGWNFEETKKWAKEYGVRFREDTSCIVGFNIGSKWGVKKYDSMQEGIICGVRNIDIVSDIDYSDNGYVQYSWEKRQKVYLVARNLRGFDRVPEEFIERVEINGK